MKKFKLYLRLFWLNIFTKLGFVLLLIGVFLYLFGDKLGFSGAYLSFFVFFVNYVAICLLCSCGFGYSSYKEYKLIITKYYKRKIEIPEKSESVYPCYRLAHKVAYNDIKNNKIWIENV